MASYTEPELRERLKQEIQDGDRGGRPGQWSARKAQLLAQEYEKAGGGYDGPKDERQQHLEQWSDEVWQTRDGEADAKGGERRYLPEAAWTLLTPKEREATETRKRDGDEQHVENTDAAKAARKVMHLPEENAREAVKLVNGLETKIELAKAKKAEKAGASRKSVLDAIEQRRERLSS